MRLEEAKHYQAFYNQFQSTQGRPWVAGIELFTTSFSPWVAGIENWVITDVFVLPVCFWNIIGQVPYPGGIVII